MCGNVGVAGKLAHHHENVFRRLLLYDVFRGADSTGVAAVRGTTPYDMHLLKKASNPLDLMEHGQFKTVVSGHNSSCFIGHNRLATKGKINNINAHPFQFGHIVGCHNGTIEQPAWAKLEEKLGEKFDVDSAAIIKGIEVLGIEETIKTIWGAWALVWYNQQENTINFLKNDKRPLHICFEKTKDVLYWSSEYQIFTPSIELAKPEIEMWTDKKGYMFFSLEDDHLYSVDLDELKKGLKDPLRTIKKQKIAGGAPPVVERPPFTPTNNHNTWTPTTRTTSTGGRTGGSGGAQSNADSVVWLTVDDKEPYADIFKDKKEFEKIFAHECSWCANPVSYGEKGLTLIPSEEIILCSACSRDPVGVTILLPKQELCKYTPSAH